jgi:hypothetical protein
LVLIVPRSIPDFDVVVPREDQARIGVIRIDDFSAQTLRHACIAARKVFLYMGASGVLARRSLVLDKHMFAHRISEIVSHLKDVGCGRRVLNWTWDGGARGPGITSSAA